MTADLGKCCKDLEDAMNEPPHSFLSIEDGLLYLTVGFVETEEGPGFFDQAVVFCPFCGTRLVDPEVASKG